MRRSDAGAAPAVEGQVAVIDHAVGLGGGGIVQLLRDVHPVQVEDVAAEEVIKPVNNSGTPIEIVRNDIDETNSEQLNLF